MIDTLMEYACYLKHCYHTTEDRGCEAFVVGYRSQCPAIDLSRRLGLFRFVHRRLTACPP